jgi:hypothetical protein
MDPFTIKLLIFVAVILAILFVSRLFPNSFFTKITFMWYGPTPKSGEAKSHYLFVWAFYSLKWLLFFGFTLYLVAIIVDRYFHNQFNENIYFQLIFMFGLPLLLMMALFGSIGCSVKGMYLKLLKKDSYYNEAEAIDRGNGDSLVVADNGDLVVFVYLLQNYSGRGSYHSINRTLKKNNRLFEFLYRGQLTKVPFYFTYPNEIKDKVINEFIDNAEGLPKSIEWEEDIGK